MPELDEIVDSSSMLKLVMSLEMPEQDAHRCLL
jgi:hypothetical protein